MKKYIGYFFALGSVGYLALMVFGGVAIEELNFVRLVMAFSPLFLIGGGYALYRVSQTLEENKQGVARLFSTLTSSQSPEAIQATSFIDSILEKEVSKLNTVNEEITHNLETISARAEGQVKTLQALISQSGEVSTLVSTRLHETMTALTQQLQALKDASLTLKESTLDRETKEIVMTAQRTVGEIAQTNNALQETMENASKRGYELIANLTDITDKADDAMNRFTNATSQMKGQAEELVAESKGLDRLIIEENELLEEKVVKTREYAGQFKEILDEQMTQISNVSDKVGMQIRLSEASIEKQSTILLTTVDKLLKQVEQVEGQVGLASQALLKISSQLNQELEGLGASVAGHMTRASETAIGSMKKAEAQGEGMTRVLRENMEAFQQSLIGMDHARAHLVPFIEMFEKKVSLLPQISDESQKRIIAMGRNLDQMTQSMAQIYERIGQTASKAEMDIRRIDNISDDSLKGLISQTETLMNLSHSAKESFQVLSSSLQDSFSNLSAQGVSVEQTLKSLGQSVNQEVQSLNNAMNSTQHHLENIEKKGDQQSVEAFMKGAGQLIENLQNISIDMTRLFAPKVSDELWKRYQQGERDVFARYLGKNLTEAHLSTLRRFVNTNPHFSDQVSAFTEGFDSLMASARRSTHKDLLISTFTQNPLGHIYLILKQI
ncbi:MAG: hypothetical protein JXR30_00535 [Alphaproteobacteria bacterium]|nr:hypothetical protein [Alphaproteobacteria bacterium]